ncbi:MAG: hypothetical protein CMI60_08405 [Parvibaculum sp.]|nr:hypothetical protein [Parvibaculum sp.]
MKKVFGFIVVVLVVVVGGLASFLFLAPRPADTSDVSIFEGDASLIDYCDLPELDGSGLMASQIPKAYTPGCGWESFPKPVLAECTEPLSEGVVDMRGLWLAETGAVGHVERIEQCGNRTVVTSSGIIHDFHTDGTLANGSRDIEPPRCMNTLVSIKFNDEGVMEFSPFGLPFTIVTRRIDGDMLVWTYPAIEGETRMKRICKLPDRDLGYQRRD